MKCSNARNLDIFLQFPKRKKGKGVIKGKGKQKGKKGKGKGFGKKGNERSRIR